jgi:hypothetical protein
VKFDSAIEVDGFILVIIRTTTVIFSKLIVFLAKSKQKIKIQELGKNNSSKGT